ncbi:hypothetical protein TPCCA_0504 [Treponema paraluiscuniculi Cuniculi A]|uniref:Uncharacterized protein TP_0504 n=4 Tax=Treponema TaxID=157 RepID=Y504_TREPA|nr:RecName: Full=Uncharacterized protein TP_0504 [Treponema pallidum subsp. pallidum str. Nichols]ACD70927.1 hypothetical protein TPASS_0504 [Treponema pallidum subsp. pallidum SS14]ADD72616.1 conserved hypothetical protein [Treponema pallidum subsp. pallidum str. Chicago]AEH40441.1 hypothetical protein TPCCA_0504 [Treponema paraluiscuniculi Cuniculi A]WKC72369.1 hypothetical protein TPLL2_0504 [Treponema paraluiscuniculi]AAC65493.1 predicted coding region TP0504 [Treponema pallidum subsp. pal
MEVTPLETGRARSHQKASTAAQPHAADEKMTGSTARRYLSQDHQSV